jgi:DNA recombination protein Rad52
MAFTQPQLRQLRAKLDQNQVKTRQAGGTTLRYIEGWHAIAEANRIFGFDGWDRETLSATCVASGRCRGDHNVSYIAKVRVSVRAGDILVVREGSGSGEARAFSLGQAHDLALKSAETDATKRALASFGNAFGLSLYDREHAGVRSPRVGNSLNEGLQAGPWVLRLLDGEAASTFEAPKDFAKTLREALKRSRSIEELFGVWQQNVATVRLLHRLYQRKSGADGVDGIALVTHLKVCARHIATRSKRPEAENSPVEQDAPPSPSLPARIDKSVLTISEPKRIRSKEHLRYVAQQPCIICGRAPSHAHHIRYAQSRGLALKVSDEFTVPLCAIHHSEIHTTGEERRWWQERKIDPLAIAERLWRQSYPLKPSIPATVPRANPNALAIPATNNGPAG